MDLLEMLFDHHQWATLCLIDTCAALTVDQQALTIPGTRGDIFSTLVHLVAADGRYLSLLTGDPSMITTRESGAPPSLADLRPAFAAQAGQWNATLANIANIDATLPAEGGDPEVPHATNLLLLQAIHHGNDHRTHVCSILGAHDLPAPDLDGWHHWEAHRD